MRVPHNSLIAVADGRKLLFLRNEGDADRPLFRTEQVTEQDNPADRDQKSDRAGHASSGPGTSGSSLEEADFHRIEEDRFAAAAADLLRRRAIDGDFRSLIVVAPPRTLGEMRKHYHREVSDRIAAELPKDLTNHPLDQIERILAAAE